MVHLFHEVAKRVPKGVYLESLVQSKNIISLSGIAQDNNDISSYIHNLEKSDWLDHLGLDIIKNKKVQNATAKRNEFVLTAKQTQPEVKNKPQGAKNIVRAAFKRAKARLHKAATTHGKAKKGKH